MVVIWYPFLSESCQLVNKSTHIKHHSPWHSVFCSGDRRNLSCLPARSADRSWYSYHCDKTRQKMAFWLSKTATSSVWCPMWSLRFQGHAYPHQRLHVAPYILVLENILLFWYKALWELYITKCSGKFNNRTPFFVQQFHSLVDNFCKITVCIPDSCMQSLGWVFWSPCNEARHMIPNRNVFFLRIK